MKRLSLLISDVYNKYLPFSESQKIELNLNISGSDGEVHDSDEVQAHLDEHLHRLLKKSRRHGVISIGVQGDNIVICDSETILSPLICSTLSHGRVEVKSRVGFGTTVYISTKPKSAESQKTIASSKKSIGSGKKA